MKAIVGQVARFAHTHEDTHRMALLSSYLSGSRSAVIAPHVRGDTLEIGCQRGQLRDRMAGRIGRYVGIDLSSESLDEARRRHPDCEFREVNLDDEPLGYDSEFDTIVLIAVIEHVFNLKHLGWNLARALKPGGQVVLTTPTPFGNDIVHRLGAQFGLFSRKAVDDHIVIFNRKRLDIFAREAGLILADYKRFQVGCNQLAILRQPSAAPSMMG